MRFGLNIVPVRPGELGELAVRAEQLGFESLWAGEHVLTPVELGEGYPSGSKPPFAPDSRFTEPFATLSFLASVTRRMRLGTGVLILPLHPVVPLARAIATVDVFSGGRLSLGLGAGWMRAEFAAVGQGFTDRGRRMDEMLTVLCLLFGEDRPAFDGEFHHLPPMGFEPKPVQRPHPPFLLGGASPAALRRAARTGDGWYGTQDRPGKLGSSPSCTGCARSTDAATGRSRSPRCSAGDRSSTPISCGRTAKRACTGWWPPPGPAAATHWRPSIASPVRQGCDPRCPTSTARSHW